MLFSHLAENGADSLQDLATHADHDTLQSIAAGAEGVHGLDAKTALEATCERICRAQYDPNPHPTTNNNSTDDADADADADAEDGANGTANVNADATKVTMYPYCFAQGGRCCAHTALGMATALSSSPQQPAVMVCTPGLSVKGSDLLNMRQPVTAVAFLSCAAGIRNGTVAKLAALPAALMVTIEWESGAGGAAAVAESIPRTVDLHAVYHRWGGAAQAEPGIYTLVSVTCHSPDDAAAEYTRYQAETSAANDSWLEVAGSDSSDGVQPTRVGGWSDVVATLASAKSLQPTMLAYRRATSLQNV